jgi:hypothetical protein
MPDLHNVWHEVQMSALLVELRRRQQVGAGAAFPFFILRTTHADSLHLARSARGARRLLPGAVPGHGHRARRRDEGRDDLSLGSGGMETAGEVLGRGSRSVATTSLHIYMYVSSSGAREQDRVQRAAC